MNCVISARRNSADLQYFPLTSAVDAPNTCAGAASKASSAARVTIGCKHTPHLFPGKTKHQNWRNYVCCFLFFLIQHLNLLKLAIHRQGVEMLNTTTHFWCLFVNTVIIVFILHILKNSLTCVRVFNHHKLALLCLSVAPRVPSRLYISICCRYYYRDLKFNVVKLPIAANEE